ARRRSFATCQLIARKRSRSRRFAASWCAGPGWADLSLSPPSNAYRDTWCGEVLSNRVGELVRVAGWVHRRRDHGGLVFVDLRDRTGIVQVVFNPQEAPEAHSRSHQLRSEWVVSTAGEVVPRSDDTINRDLPTGEVEI